MTPTIVAELLYGRYGNYRRPCPDCDKGPRDIALSIKVDDQGACWNCFRCGLAGSVKREASQRTFVPPSPREALRRVWKESLPMTEAVRDYLTARGLGDVLLNPPNVLRCHPRLEYFDPGEPTRHFPALVALVQDRTGTAVSLHRTYLQGSGKAPVRTPKKLMPPVEKGACSRAAIRLHPISRDGVLAVAEGIESALTIGR